MPFRCVDGYIRCSKHMNIYEYLTRIETLLAVSTKIENSTLPAVIDISYLDMAKFFISKFSGSHYLFNGTI